MESDMVEKTVETVFEMVMRKMFGMYFVQVVTILLILFLIISGNFGKILSWLTSFRKVKVGNKVELEGGEVIPERRHDLRRASDKELVKQQPCDTDGCRNMETLAESNKMLVAEITKIRNHQDETWTIQLKNTFYSEHMPIHDRMISGLKYVWWIEKHEKLNGNTKNDVKDFAYKNYSTYLAVTAMDDKLRIKEIEERI